MSLYLEEDGSVADTSVLSPGKICTSHSALWLLGVQEQATSRLVIEQDQAIPLSFTTALITMRNCEYQGLLQPVQNHRLCSCPQHGGVFVYCLI